MIVGQPAYFVLLFIAALAVFTAPAAFRWLAVLAASIAFYWIYTGFSVLIFVPALVSFFCARRIECHSSSGARRIFLAVALCVNAGLLVFFKIQGAFKGDAWLLPLGLSFYSLQLTGYVLDIYWKRAASEPRIGVFLSFATFFPHLTAGPIERSTTLLPQMAHLPGYDHTRVRIGILLILTGLIKKLAVAEALMPAVNAVFSESFKFSGAEIILGSVLARYALFFDFSGYTDIAIGSAAVLGIVSSPNFNRPFSSHSIAEFWRRWHMTLSAWMKDYVFFPFISGPGVKLGLSASLLFTFIVLGLWHEFSWNFFLFGATQGLLMAAHVLTRPLRESCAAKLSLSNWPRLHGAAQIIFTQIALVSLPMIFFRAKTVDQSVYLFSHLFSGSGERAWGNFSELIASFPTPWYQIAGLILTFELLAWINVRRTLTTWVVTRPTPLRWAIYALVVFTLIALGRFEAPADFAYRKY